MSKLKLCNIFKSYKAGDTKVQALSDVSLAFRQNEFVSILGPSGCGKTTLLNLIGGLDRYDKGDLVINGLSTKAFKGADWDAYRNKSVGFVFQSYNLISHQSVLQNVEIAMTLAGVSAAERKKRAKDALAAVSILDQAYKKPNQLSGGQMQRVAIARALVNNPDIILADEPTGALDSQTSVQIMGILKDIAKTKLVIMVTHNSEMANEYSSRVVKLLDGQIISDSNPVKDEVSGSESKEPPAAKYKKTSMTLMTATELSFKNLLTKKGRTIITAIAGSIGIIGIALVLALSNGLTGYIGKMQSESLSGFPITIGTSQQAVNFRDMSRDNEAKKYEKFTSGEIIYRYDRNADIKTHTNILTDEYLEYLNAVETALPNAVNTISYSRSVDFNLLSNPEGSVIKFGTAANGAVLGGFSFGESVYWQELPANSEFILSLYDLIGEGSRLPVNKNEIAIVVDEYNRIDEEFFQKLGCFGSSSQYGINDFVGASFIKVIPNNDFYTMDENGLFAPATTSDYESLYNNESVGFKLTITGVLRIKEGAASSYLSEGIAYTNALSEYMLDDAVKSDIAVTQKSSDINVITGTPFASGDAKKLIFTRLGSDSTPSMLNIYPKDFASKENIKKYLTKYNEDKSEDDQIIFIDFAESITNMIGTLINTITYVLVGFAAISLIVSTIMIGIITYVSVLERTKEIGILRSVGARKKDVSRVFNAETLIVGFVAGLLGVTIAYLLTIPINAVIFNLVEIKNIANLSLFAAVVLILGSMALTLIAGLIPARVAAKKDPVVALRTE